MTRTDTVTCVRKDSLNGFVAAGINLPKNRGIGRVILLKMGDDMNHFCPDPWMRIIGHLTEKSERVFQLRGLKANKMDGSSTNLKP